MLAAVRGSGCEPALGVVTFPSVSCRAWRGTNPRCSSSLTASPLRGCCSRWRGWGSCATGQCTVGTRGGWQHPKVAVGDWGMGIYMRRALLWLCRAGSGWCQRGTRPWGDQDARAGGRGWQEEVAGGGGRDTRLSSVLPQAWLPSARGCSGIARGSPHLHGPAG